MIHARSSCEYFPRGVDRMTAHDVVFDPWVSRLVSAVSIPHRLGVPTNFVVAPKDLSSFPLVAIPVFETISDQ